MMSASLLTPHVVGSVMQMPTMFPQENAVYSSLMTESGTKPQNSFWPLSLANEPSSSV